MLRIAIVSLAVLAACGGPSSKWTGCDSWQGVSQWGTPAADEALGMVAFEGGVLVVGYRGGVVHQTNIEPAGDSRAFVRKLSTSGALEWDVELETAGTDVAEAVSVAGARIFVAGRTSGAFPGFTNAGQFDAFVAELGLDGSLLRLTQWGDDRPQHPRRLAAAGGSLFLGGYDDTFVPSNFVQDWQNPLAARFGLDSLQLASARPFRSVFADVAYGMAVEPDGSAMYLAGTNLTGSQPGIWARKLDPAGNETWGVRLTPGSADFGAAAALSPNGELLIGGVRFASGTQPIVLAVEPATGRPLWTAELPWSVSAAFATDLALDRAGNIYLAGTVASSIVPGAPPVGDFAPFVIRFDPRGKPTGTWQIPSTPEEDVSAVTVDSCGRVLVAGWTTGTVPDGTNAGSRDAFLVEAKLVAIP